jgi:hypothetical protein
VAVSMILGLSGGSLLAVVLQMADEGMTLRDRESLKQMLGQLRPGSSSRSGIPPGR